VGILVKEANNNAFGFDLNLMREIQFTEYRAENEDHYKWHEDLSWRVNKASHRKLSVVIQLSDQGDYEGGDLELQHEAPEPEALKRQGTVIVFPSFHSHRVTPITKGVRYSLVAWYEGPKFK
jgi:PKHD-type hydroxylase